MKAQIRACSEDPTIGLSRRWDTRFGWGLTIHRTRRNACLPIPLRWWPGYRNRTCPRSSLRPSSTASTLLADQQGCQKGLDRDHSGGYRIEPWRKIRVPVGSRPGEFCFFEVRPSEVRPGKVRPGKVRLGEVRPDKVCLGEARTFKVRPLEPRPFEYRPSEVRPAEVRPNEVRPSEVRPSEVRPDKVRLGEVRPSEVRPDEVRPCEVRPAEVRPV